MNRRSRALLAPLVLALAAPPALATNWTYATVDAARYAGNSLVMRLNAQGAKRYAWWTSGAGIVVAGDGWPTEVLPAVYEPQDGAAAGTGRGAGPAGTQLLITYSTDLALGPDDTPWVVQVRHDCFGDCTGIARVRHRTPAGWSTENLGVAYSRPAIAAGADGRVHVAYGDLSGQIQYRVRQPGGGWLGEYVGPGLVGELSIALDGAGRPHLAWAAGGMLWYAVRMNDGWRAEAVDSGGVSMANLDLEPAGARIAYVVAGPAQSASVWYAEQAAGGWEKSLVRSGAPVGTRPGIATDPAGDPFLAFNDQAGLDLRFATRKDGAWTVGDVDTYGNTGYYPSVAFDPSGLPLVAYQADAVVGVRLATGDAVVLGVPSAPPPAARLSVRALGPARAGEPLVIEVRAAEAGTVTLTLHDVAGRVLARLADRPVAGGANTVSWDAGVLAPGVHFVRTRDAAGGAASTAVAVLR